jgi:hypothetical protein
MLTNRQISENFEVQINTLYNWRKSKPRLYRYLQNADYNFEQSKEINVLLDRFAREIRGDFTPKEIQEVIVSKFEARSIDDIEHMEFYFVKEHAKRLAKEGMFLLGVYDSIHALGIIEKYIFYKRVHNFRSEKREPTVENIRGYFDVFVREEDTEKKV